MKNSFAKHNIFIIILSILSLFIILGFSCVTHKTKSYGSMSYSSYYTKNTITVTNGDFTDYSKNSNNLPYSIDSGWSNITGLNKDTAIAGIIDVNEENFEDKNKFTLDANPNTDKDIQNADDNILMIKAKKTNLNNGTKYGYISNSISLSANKFYMISVHCKTGLLDKNNNIISNTNAIGSIYTSLSNNDNQNFTNIKTDGFWKTYNIFVSTDTYNSQDFTIELRLGNKYENSNGVIFFDDIKIFEIANIDYFSNLQNETESQNKFINLNNSQINDGFANANYDTTLNSWDITNGWKILNGDSNISTPSIDSINETISNIEDEESNYANSFIYGKTNSLLINNLNETYSSISSTNDNYINILQHNYYALTVLYKTGTFSSGGLNITLSQLVSSGEAITSTVSDLSSSDGLDEYNGFSKQVFYIQGSMWEDCKVGINFELGTSEQNISGWAIIDNIKLEKISQSEYESNSSSTTLNLSENIKEISSVNNGSFDFIISSERNSAYPMTPKNWTPTNGDLSGVIRLLPEDFNIDCVNYGLTSSNNPGPNNSYSEIYKKIVLAQNENVLMIRTNNTNDSYFTSSTVSLSTNSYTTDNNIDKFEIGVKTLNNAKAFLKLVDENNNLLAIIDNISANDWTKYTLFIRNGMSSENVSLVLGVHGTENNDNYAFFDYADFTNINSEDITLNNILNTNNSCYTDLIQDSFYNRTNKSVLQNVYSPSNWSTYSLDDQSSTSLYNGITKTTSLSNINVHSENLLDKNILMLRNDSLSYQVLMSNYTYSIKEGNYYEFSVWVKTEINSEQNNENFGAYIELASYNNETKETTILDTNKNKFVNIITNDDKNEGWVKYSIYILAESDENIKMLIGLGTESNLTLGKVYFDDMTSAQIEKDEYVKKTANENTIISKIISSTSSSSEKDNQENNVETTSTPINLFALFSSIILALALIFAIAGYIIRRIPKKQKDNNLNKATSNYSKSPFEVDKKSVSNDLKLKLEEKKKKALEDLTNLKNEKQNLQLEYEQKYKDENNISKQEKLYIKYTKKINALTKQIEYIESALVYLSEQINIKTMEKIEIKSKQKQIKKEFEKLQNGDNDKKIEENTNPNKARKKKK